ncbi:low-density lipoprotein receptor-related protein 4-like [Liolophura sinensis]|uniref:low-density lipoprotein receptor-related protein 4-like n=1 Tax=Liolophura sinensis TaxID=3198878 RepID=UPI003159517F
MCLSYDWLTDTIYWTDSGANQIKSYAVGAGGPVTVVLSLHNTLGPLTLDPFTRQIFWINRTTGDIKSAFYNDSDSVKTLVTSGINTAGIHCDPVKQKLFWTDRNKVNSVYTNGTGGKTVITTDLNHNNRGLVVHKELVFWTSYGPSAYIDSGNLYHKVHRTRSTFASQPLVDLDILDNYVRQQTRGVCFENGGCDHYCVPTGGATRECRCELGFKLQTDGQTCSTEFLSVDHFLMADLIAGRFYQVDMNTGNVSGTFKPMGNSETVSVNPDHSMVYWSDFVQREIRSSDLTGSNMKTVFTLGVCRAHLLL